MAFDIKPVYWENGRVKIIDQTCIPDKFVELEFSNYKDVINAIRTMQVRGAPAIGVTAAFGMALAAQSIPGTAPDDFMKAFNSIADEFRTSRPTAVNLFWAIDRMLRTAEAQITLPTEALKQRLINEAIEIMDDDIRINRRLGAYGAELISDGASVLTHCNAGALATAGYGTALGVIRAAVESGKKISVISDETRPRLQGMRLTAWELVNNCIPVTIITDNMAGWAMAQGMIDCVVVGADRITANGDVANKVGTYGAAVLAKAHGIPFYVAAPVSTIDFSLPEGKYIPIEERDPEEVTHICGVRIAPEGAKVYNPSFDVTPAEYVTAIITEYGVMRAPYLESLAPCVLKQG